MWKRFIRALKALFGGAVAAIEDPKLIIEQNMRELNDKVPKLNADIAKVKANVNLLENQLQKDQAKFRDLDAKVKASINAGRDDLAGAYVGSLQQTKATIVQTQEQLEQAKRAYEKVIEAKKVFMKERERKMEEAKEALRAHERSKIQAEIANTLEQFEVGGIDQTHDEMLNRINEKTAQNEARMEMALDSIDTSKVKMDEEVEKIKNSDLLAQYKREMGLGGSTTAENTGDGFSNRNSVL